VGVQGVNQALPGVAAAAQAPAPAVGREAFMQLLVAQLKAQDPLDPMDSRDFITQLSQLTGVEQLTMVADRVASLEVATAGMANTQVASLVGRQVTAQASGLRVEEMGPAESVFQLSGPAKEVTVTIRDGSGRTVRTMQMGEMMGSQHRLSWDGNDESGERVEPGRYTFEVSAKDAQGHPIEATTKVTGLVRGISYEHGYPELVIGEGDNEAQLLLGDVVSISM
jgi:flagellar basal-body rod modification protein FlgD